MAGGTTTTSGTTDGSGARRRGDGRGRAEVSPAAKLCGFLVLLVLVFIAAYAAGARLGPVTTGHSAPGRSQPMNMGAPAGRGRARR